MITHLTEIELLPTPAQAQDLRQLRAACGTVALATAEQSRRLARGQDGSIAVLLGGADSPDRSPLGEANELTKHGDVAWAPRELLLNAIVSQRAEGKARHLVAAPVPLGGAGWLTQVSWQGVRLRGVRGVVAAHLEPLRRWGVLATAPGEPPRARVTGSAWVECDRAEWTLDVELECWHKPEFWDAE